MGASRVHLAVASSNVATSWPKAILSHPVFDDTARRDARHHRRGSDAVLTAGAGHDAERPVLRVFIVLIAIVQLASARPTGSIAAAWFGGLSIRFRADHVAAMVAVGLWRSWACSRSIILPVVSDGDGLGGNLLFSPAAAGRGIRSISANALGAGALEAKPLDCRRVGGVFDLSRPCPRRRTPTTPTRSPIGRLRDRDGF